MIHVSAYPLVAIITPVYNGEAYLDETMEAVQALHYPNLVHVVLDNASRDATPHIIERYRNRRVPLLTHRRADTVCMADNWNQAVAMTPPDARYFRILCADDTLRADAIDRLVEVAERDSAIGVVGCLWRFCEHALCGEELPADREIFDGREVIRSYLRREHAGLAGMNVLVRRSEIHASRPFYDGSIISFDSEVNVRICMHAKFGFVRSELGLWRIHPGSTTSHVRKLFAHELCWLRILDRYGPDVLGFRDYMECRITYRRHLLRKLLQARCGEGGEQVFAQGLDQLRRNGDPAGPIDFADALAEWGKLALLRQRHRVGKPRPKGDPGYAAPGAMHATGL